MSMPYGAHQLSACVEVLKQLSHSCLLTCAHAGLVFALGLEHGLSAHVFVSGRLYCLYSPNPY